MQFSPAESLQLYTLVCRIFDSVSCTYTGEARSEAKAALDWLAQIGPRDDPELAPLIAAIQYARTPTTPGAALPETQPDHPTAGEARAGCLRWRSAGVIEPRKPAEARSTGGASASRYPSRSLRESG